MREYRIGTRESRLAVWQANWVAQRLRELRPGITITLVGIKTKGDNILDAALSKIGDKGLFTRELEVALVDGQIDMAVHSMKDLPTQLPQGLVLGAICQREHPGDVLVSKEGKDIDELTPGAVIGTSSLRRIAQLKYYRQDLTTVDVRGNLTTRLRKLDEQKIDALVLAYAGLVRLQVHHRITQILPFHISLPAVGQGAIGVEVREDDGDVKEMLALLNHRESHIAVSAERSLMRCLEGGCQIPVGALALVDGNEVIMEAMVADLDGNKMIRMSQTGTIDEPEGLGEKLAQRMLDRGADVLLKKIRQEFDVHDR